MTREQLLRYLKIEVIGDLDRELSLWRLWRRARKHGARNFVFWFRIAQYLYASDNRLLKSVGKAINRRMMRRYSVEIMLGVQIGEGLFIGHPIGIVVNSGCVIGKNFTLRQNTTIGTTAQGLGDHQDIIIGDNVRVGANSCIVGSGLTIGDNVTIGAMSFVNKDIPSNSVYMTRKESLVKPVERVGLNA